MRVTLLKASGVSRFPSLRKIKFAKFNGRAKSPSMGVPRDGKEIEKERGIVYKRGAEITTTTRGIFLEPGWFLKLTIFW